MSPPIVVTKTREHVRAAREAAYLADWPAHKVNEAREDREDGRGAKWEAYLAFRARVRAENPYPDENEQA